MKSLVTLHLDASEETALIDLRVTNREYGRRHILLFEKRLSEALREPQTTVIDKDIYNFVELRYDNDANLLFVTITWLSQHGKDEVSGTTQTLRLNASKVFQFTETGKDAKFVYDDTEETYPRIQLTDTAHNRVRKILDEGGKHNLTRFFRNAFRWPLTKEILVYDDPWVGGFGFSENRGIRGGIVPHTTNIVGRDGNHYPKTVYEIHT